MQLERRCKRLLDKLSIKPKILELNNSNDIYMTLNICILSNDVNYNNAQFTDDFIDGVIENKETYIGIPFVVNRSKLENGDYDNLNHELHNGELKTDQIGSFVDFWKEEIDGANCLIGSIRVFKRFVNTCNAIIELYENGELETSCEVLVREYLEVTDDGIRKIHYNEGRNVLIGSCLVSDPAERRAKATLLIAEAHKKDLNDQKGGEKMNKKELFNKGHEIKYHIEKSEMSIDDIRDQIYNLLNPIDPETEERKYRYLIREMFQSYVIVESWNETDKLYKVNYTVEDEKVSIAPKSEWIQVELTYQPVNTDLNSLVSEKEKEINELNNKISQLKEELETMSQQNKDLNKEYEEKIAGLQAKVDDLNALVVSEQEAKTALEEKIKELNAQIEELKPYKENFEKTEKEKQMTELSEKYSKLLSEDTFKSERVQKAIEELNVTELNSVVVEEIAKQKVETSSKKTDDIVVVASQEEDLLPKNKHEYWASPRA
jgi:predicted  nucleic acid-binding Zn-ribbon protein